MGLVDIIPDIHGQAAKLRAALDALGWRRSAAGWRPPSSGRRLLFLGDFIDRGPENAAVIGLVRDLIDAGHARAIMGNHELNALHFHTPDPETGQPLRPHVPKNLTQHASFLAEFPPGAAATREVLRWMQSLPLFLEEPGFRAVHASWSAPAIAQMRACAPDGVLSEAQLVEAADPASPLFAAAEEVTKGPEHPLPDGHAFIDKDGTERRKIRLRWWSGNARNWRDIAISVPDPHMLPDTPLPRGLRARTYPPTERPVFFGHYWLSGRPVLQARNALCLDYSAGTDGPLVTYLFEDGDGAVTLDRIQCHEPPE